jgi:hypothetical protein
MVWTRIESIIWSLFTVKVIDHRFTVNPVAIVGSPKASYLALEHAKDIRAPIFILTDSANHLS